MTIAMLLATIESAREQQTSPLFSEANSQRRASQPCEQGRFERVLEERSQVEAARAQEPRRFQKSAQALFLSAIGNQFVNKRRIFK
jgi:hypothetical protein